MLLIAISLTLSLTPSAGPLAQYTYPPNAPAPGGGVQPYAWWSTTYGSLPPGSVVTIPAGTTIYLDEDTVELGGLIVRGS